MLKDRRVLAFALLYFTMVVNVYGLSFWVGEIVDKINGLSDVGKGFVTAIPYTVAIVGMVVIPRHSRPHRRAQARTSRVLPRGRRGRVRGQHDRRRPVAAVAALAVGLFFLLGAHGVFWTMPAALLSGAAAAAGIALINSIGNLGGFVGPYLVGLVKDATGSTDGGLVALALILLAGAVLATRVVHDPAPRARAARGAALHARRRPRRGQPRPTNGIRFAITVMNRTFASSGRLAM